MGHEGIRLHTRDRRTIDGEADVVRYSTGARLLRGGAIVAVGVAIGGASILIPVLHLVVPWLAPLFALGLAIYVVRAPVVVREIRGVCPDCSTSFAVTGGSVTEDLWVRCPKCTLPLRVEVSR